MAETEVAAVVVAVAEVVEVVIEGLIDGVVVAPQAVEMALQVEEEDGLVTGRALFQAVEITTLHGVIAVIDVMRLNLLVLEMLMAVVVVAEVATAVASEVVEIEVALEDAEIEVVEVDSAVEVVTGIGTEMAILVDQ